MERRNEEKKPSHNNFVIKKIGESNYVAYWLFVAVILILGCIVIFH